jgi:hypothetical protein
MFLRVHKRFLKDTYFFPSVSIRLGWVFNISYFLVDKLCFIACLLNVSVVFDTDDLILRNK